MLSDDDLLKEAEFRYEQSLRDGNNQSYGKQGTSRPKAIAIKDYFNGIKLENIVYDEVGMKYYPADHRRQYKTKYPDIEKNNKKGEIRKITQYGKVPIRQSDICQTERYLIVGTVEPAKVYGYILIQNALKIAAEHPEWISNPYGGEPACFVPVEHLPLKPINEF